LSVKVKDKKFIVIDKLNFENPKTKKAAEILDNLKVSGSKVLLVLENSIDNTAKSFRNLENVLVTSSKSLNTYNILVADYVIFTKKSLMDFTKGLGNERS
jgi:large subunit ribosomal protein L4